MYKIKDKKSLLRLLKQHDLKGLGGILLDDIQESLPHCDKHLKVILLLFSFIKYIIIGLKLYYLIKLFTFTEFTKRYIIYTSSIG